MRLSLIKAQLVSLVEAGAAGDREAIRASVFSPNFRAKILSTYYPDKYLGVFSTEHMRRFAGELGIGYGESDDHAHAAQYHRIVNSFAADIERRDVGPMLKLVIEALQVATARRILQIEQREAAKFGLTDH